MKTQLILLFAAIYFASATILKPHSRSKLGSYDKSKVFLKSTTLESEAGLSPEPEDRSICYRYLEWTEGQEGCEKKCKSLFAY